MQHFWTILNSFLRFPTWISFVLWIVNLMNQAPRIKLMVWRGFLYMEQLTLHHTCIETDEGLCLNLELFPLPFQWQWQCPKTIRRLYEVLGAGSNYYVRILSTLNRELLKPSSSVALHRHSNALVEILPPEADSSISLLSNSERPDVTYAVSPLSPLLLTLFLCCPSFTPDAALPCIWLFCINSDAHPKRR